MGVLYALGFASLPRLGKFLAFILLNKFSAPFSFFWYSYNIKVIMFDGITELPKQDPAFDSWGYIPKSELYRLYSNSI